MSAQLLINGNNAHKAVEAVLFDKDGTIIDIHHYWTSMIRIRSVMIIERWFSGRSDKKRIESELIDTMGVDLLSGRMKREGPVGIKPRQFIVNVAANVVRENGIDISNDEMEILFSDVDKNTSKDMLPLLKLLPGSESLLKKLKKKGVALVIVSTDITSRACKAMESLGLDHLFDDIIGADQVDHTKPAADLALLAMRRTGVDPLRVVVVGDHPVDIHMGISANVSLNIGVLTGLSDIDAFRGMNCRVATDLTSIEIQ